MNVVVMIQSREAIPVRAIPLLTDWEVLSPDELAGALTGDYPHNTSFEKLTAYSSENGRLKDVRPRWWSSFPVRKLEALNHRIKHKEISHDDGYEQWRRESLPVLPSGVFVWKDEFEACFWSAYGPDGEIEWVAVEGGFKKRKRKEFIELDFEPLVAPEFSDLVMMGFEAQATYSAVPESQTKPVGADSASSDCVEPDKAMPLPLTTGDIAFCFAGLRWSEQEWRKPLGDKPKWLQSCVVTPAQRGVSETRWNPILIAAWLVQNRNVRPNKVRAKFQTQPLLKPWRDEWKTYEADNFDTS